MRCLTPVNPIYLQFPVGIHGCSYFSSRHSNSIFPLDSTIKLSKLTQWFLWRLWTVVFLAIDQLSKYTTVPSIDYHGFLVSEFLMNHSWKKAGRRLRPNHSQGFPSPPKVCRVSHSDILKWAFLELFFFGRINLIFQKGSFKWTHSHLKPEKSRGSTLMYIYLLW